jgi:hypothetical protein
MARNQSTEEVIHVPPFGPKGTIRSVTAQIKRLAPFGALANFRQTLSRWIQAGHRISHTSKNLVFRAREYWWRFMTFCGNSLEKLDRRARKDR